MAGGVRRVWTCVRAVLPWSGVDNSSPEGGNSRNLLTRKAGPDAILDGEIRYREGETGDRSGAYIRLASPQWLSW